MLAEICGLKVDIRHRHCLCAIAVPHAGQIKRRALKARPRRHALQRIDHPRAKNRVAKRQRTFLTIGLRSAEYRRNRRKNQEGT
jgi:hypothetical protein